SAKRCRIARAAWRMCSAAFTLLPMATNTWMPCGAPAITAPGSSSRRAAGRAIRLAPALDAYPDVARMADRARLVDADAHPCERELRQQQQRETMGQRLDQMKLRCLHPGEPPLGDRFVIHGIGHRIAPRGALAVAGQLQIDHH